MSRAEPPEAGLGRPPSPPPLSDLGCAAARLQEALGQGDEAARRELLRGWRAWLGGTGADSAFLRSVLDAVAGWGGGGLARTEFETVINRLWAARLDELDGEETGGNTSGPSPA